MGLMGMNNNMMYLAGDGGYGQGANAFANNFLNAWKTVGEEKRADAMKAMQEKIMAAQVEEYLNKQAMRQALGEFDKGLMNPVEAPARSVPFKGMAVPEELQGVKEGEQVAVPAGQFPNQLAAWKAQGLNPDQEYLKRASGLLAGFDPEKALDLKTKLMLGEDNIGKAIQIAMLNNLTRKDVQGMKGEQAIEQILTKFKTPNVNVRVGSGSEKKDSDMRTAYLEAKLDGSFKGNYADFMKDMSKAKEETKAEAQKDVAESKKKSWERTIPAAGKRIVRTGTYNGRKVVEYSDGTRAYAN